MKIEIKGMEALKAKLHAFPKELARAERNAVNTTATAVKNLGIDEAFKSYHVDKKSRLKKDSRGRDVSFIKRAREGEITARVIFRGGDNPKAGDRIGIQHFKVDKQARNKKEKGWRPSIKVLHSGAAEKIEHGFYGVGKLKGQGIFQRQGGGRKLVRRTGPSLKQMVERAGVYSAVEQKGHDILKQALTVAINKQIAKRK